MMMMNDETSSNRDPGNGDDLLCGNDGGSEKDRDPLDTMIDSVRSDETPTPEFVQRIDMAWRDLLETIDRTVIGIEDDTIPRPVRVEMVGSVPKGTYLQDSVDLDVFLLFDPGVTREGLTKAGLTIGHGAIGGHAKYAEHPYVSGTWEGFKVDIVPCYAVDSVSERISAVDRTPFHTRYVLETLTSEQQEDVRVLKRFLKGIGTYGSGPGVKGFSGYMVELLIIRYGSFRDTLTAIAGWSPPLRMTVQGDGPSGMDPSVLKTYSHDVFIISDPIDPPRNAASAISEDVLHRTRFSTLRFLSEPSLSYFYPVPHDDDAVNGNGGDPSVDTSDLTSMYRERGSSLVSISIPGDDVLDDIILPQLDKTLQSLVDRSRSLGFDVLTSGHSVQPKTSGGTDIVFVIEFATLELSRTMVHGGPPYDSDQATRFIEKWGHRSELSGRRLIAFRERPYTHPLDMVKGEFQRLAHGKMVARWIRERGMVVNDASGTLDDHPQVVRKLWSTSIPGL